MVLVVLVMVMAMVVAFDRPSANGSLMAATTECANRPAERGTKWYRIAC